MRNMWIRSGVGLCCVLLSAQVVWGDTVTYHLDLAADDTLCTSAGSNYNTSTMYFPFYAATRYPFVRFSLAGIPAGATIQSAYLSVKASSTNSGACIGRFQLVDSDNCPDFTTNPFTWAVTATGVDWSVGDWTSGNWYTSPDLKELVQEFVDRPGYSSGGYMGLRFGYVSGGLRSAYQCNSGAGNGAELEVTYATNVVPTADAGPDQCVIDSDCNGSQAVALDGSASSDSDGTLVSHVWTEDATQIATGATPMVTLATGAHTITLTVTDDLGATDSDTVVVSVIQPQTVTHHLTMAADDTACASGSNNYNSSTMYFPFYAATRYPFVRFALGVPAGATIQSAYLSVKASSTNSGACIGRFQLVDSDNCPDFTTNPFTWAVTATGVDWSVGDWTSGNWYTSPDLKELVQEFVDRPGYSSGGYMGLRFGYVSGGLRIAYQCNSGAGNGAELEITYVGGNWPPTADAGQDQEVVDSDDNGVENVTLDGTGSYDQDAGDSIISYVWTEDGTPIATGATPTVALALGTHTLTLTVTDAFGAIGTDTVDVTVTWPIYSTYYVDFDNGSDSHGGGSPARAWQHCPGDPNATMRPAEVAELGVAPGTTIIFKGGVHYRGSLTLNMSGSDGNRIVLDGNTAGTFGTGPAILDGSEPLTGWTQCTSAAEAGGNPNYANIWYAYAPAGVTAWSSNLYENDSVCTMAQDPNQPDLWLMDKLSCFHSIPPADMTTTSVKDATHLNQADPGYWDGASIMLHVIPNVINYRTISSFNPETNTLTYATTGSPYADINGAYAIFNSIHLIDQPGEYYFNDTPEVNGTHKVWLWPPVAGNPNSQSVTVSTRPQAIDANESSYITLQGLIIQKYASDSSSWQCQGIQMRDSDHVVVQDCTFRRLRHIMTSGYGTGYGAIWGDGTWNVIQNNVFEEIMNSEGLLVGGSYLVIANNSLIRIGRHGIWYMDSLSHDVLITGNTVQGPFGTHGAGISVFGTNASSRCYNVTVSGNHVSDCGEAYSFCNLYDSTWAYNYGYVTDNFVMHDNGKLPTSFSDNIALYNNTLIRTDNRPSFAFNPDSTYVMKNNLMLTYLGTPGSLTPDANGNIHFNLSQMGSLFVDAASRDFHLKPNSVSPPFTNTAIDAGLALGYEYDLEGTAVPQGGAPDIGAYESTGQ